MEETRKRAGKAKKKKSGKSKPVIIINFNFNKFFCYAHTCRHKKGEGLGVKTPFHDFGEPDDNISGCEFGPGSKGPST
jgi:hypothetical protein